MHKIKIKRWIWGVLAGVLLSILFAASCTQSEKTTEGVNIGGDYDWPGGDGDAGESEIPGGCPEIEKPLPPELPECLQGDNPPGCAELPRLPECLQGDNPPGCAELPRMQDWDCPDGWNSVPAFVDEEGNENVPDGMEQYTICEPPELPETCPEGFMPLLGNSDCVHIGDPCPLGDFPTVPEEIPGNRIYVKTGTIGGDGSIGSPFTIINEALAVASNGDVIVIAEGHYEEALEPQVDVTLFGACVEKVTIDAPGPHGGQDVGAVLVKNGRKVQLYNLRISGSQNGIRVMDSSSEVIAKGIWIHQATMNGIFVKHGTVNLEESFISDIQLDPEGELGRGISACYGARVTAIKNSFDSCKEAGIVASGWEQEPQTQLTLSDLVIRNTLSDASGSWGDGLLIQMGAIALVTGGFFTRNKNSGISVTSLESDLQTELIFTDIVVRETQSSENGQFGRGLSVQGGAFLDAGGSIIGSRIRIENNATDGLYAYAVAQSDENPTEPPSLEISDVVIKNNGKKLLSEQYNDGIYIGNGVQAALSRILISRNKDYGVLAFGWNRQPQTELALTDIVVRDTQSDENGENGLGLAIQDGVILAATRILLERNVLTGFRSMSDFKGLPNQIEIQDLNVRDTKSTDQNTGGEGVIIRNAAEATIERATIVCNGEVGIAIESTDNELIPHVIINDILSAETRQAAPYDYGLGLHFTNRVKAAVDGAVLLKNAGFGILSGTSDQAMVAPEVTLNDIVIRDTLEVQDSDGDFYAMGIQNGTVANGERWLLENNIGGGLHLGAEDWAKSPQLMVSDLTVNDTRCIHKGELFRCGGANVQDGSDAEITNAVFERNKSGGIAVFGTKTDSSPTVLTLANILIRDQEIDAELGEGLGIYGNVEVSVSGALITDVQRHGIFCIHDNEYGGPFTVTIEDVLVADTKLDSSGAGGHGLEIARGGSATLRRVKLHNNKSAGVLAINDHPDRNTLTIDFSDIYISNTHGYSINNPSKITRGLQVQDVTQLSLVRGLFEFNQGIGLAVKNRYPDISSELKISHLWVRNGESTEEGLSGRGIELADGTNATLDHIIIDGNREVGLLVYGGNASNQTNVVMTDFCVIDTQLAACGELDEGEERACYYMGQNLGGGNGLAAVEGGQVTLRDFFISGSAVSGILISRDGIVEAHRGTITGNAIGINILDPGYDTSLLEDEVYNFDNTVDFARKDMPLPDPSELIGPLDFEQCSAPGHFEVFPTKLRHQ